VGLILLATAIGGVVGYVVTWLVPREIGFSDYAPFAGFWAFLFLLVSALSGIQQEVTRATGTEPKDGARGRPGRLAAALSASVAVLLLGTAALWVSRAFPEGGWGLVWPLAVGSCAYAVTAVIYGSLYAARRWSTLCWLISTDAVLRLAAVGATLAFTRSLVALAWAVALPIPLALLVWSVRIRQSLSGGVWLDVPYRRLSWNFSRTVVAAASMGVLVSGLPLLLGLTARDEPRANLGLMISAVTLTRAPLIVIAMSLQSYLVVMFKSGRDTTVRLFGRFAAVLIAAGVVLGLAGLALGPVVFGILFPREARPSGPLILGLVASSALVGLLYVSSAAVLAHSRHVAYAAGWIAAAVATVAFLVTPLEFETRTLLALLSAPVVGLVVQGTLFFVSRGESRATAISP
jgi:hypothetical protein